MLRKILIIISITLFAKCGDVNRDLLVGTWALEDFTINDEHYEYALLANIVGFDKDGVCHLPITGLDEFNIGNWSIYYIENDTVLKIDTEGSMFDGEYKLTLKNDPKRNLLIMIMQNDSLYMQSAKVF